MKHPLYEELDDCVPDWQSRYPTLAAAAAAINCSDLYQDYLKTPAGQHYLERIMNTRDYRQEAEERARATDDSAAAIRLRRTGKRLGT